MLLCPLVERCCCPCETKIVEVPGQFIQHIHAEYTAADHATNYAKFLTHDKQNLIRNAVKTAQSVTYKTHQRRKSIQGPKLKESVARLTCHGRAKLLTVVSRCDGVELNSNICSLKTLGDKIFIKDAIRAHIHGLSIGAPQCIDCFKTFCISKAFVGSKRCAIIAFSNIFNLLT